MRVIDGGRSDPDDRANCELLDMLEIIAASPEFVLHAVPVPDRVGAVVVRLRNETANGSWDDEILGCLTPRGALTLVQRHEAELLAARHVAFRGFVNPLYHIAWEGAALARGRRG